MIKKKLREIKYYLKSLKNFRLTSLNKKRIAVLCVLAAVIISLISLSVCVTVSNIKEADAEAPAQETEEPRPEKYMIQNVKVIAMDDLKAGCETYACTMLMNTIGFDLDEHTFADNYLDCHYVFLDEDGFGGTGPDMYSAFAGTAYGGWGVYAPSMAKSMNKYLADQKSDLKAYAMENVELEDLIDQYVVKGIPVMIWATTYMQEPYVYHTWTVNYVDENAKTKIGDTFSWYMHEHCLVLIGYDKDYYYFGDSTAGTISHFKKDLVKQRYKQMFMQSIVVK